MGHIEVAWTSQGDGDGHFVGHHDSLDASRLINDWITELIVGKVDAIRNQHPYVISYVSAKHGKIFDSREKKNLEEGLGQFLAPKMSQSHFKCLKTNEFIAFNGQSSW